MDLWGRETINSWFEFRDTGTALYDDVIAPKNSLNPYDENQQSETQY